MDLNQVLLTEIIIGWAVVATQCLDMMKGIPLQISQKVLKTLYRNSQEEFPPFKINYFVAHFRYNSTYYKNLFNEVSLLDLHVINKISWYIAIYTRCLKKINNNNFFFAKRK